MTRYLFKLELGGDGDTPEAAWQDAIEAFMLDPGMPEPEDITIEQKEDKDVFTIAVPTQFGRQAKTVPDQYARALKRMPRVRLYIPKLATPAAVIIKAKSAIVGVPSGDTERVEIYYEGNVNGACNLTRFAERCQCAFGRLATNYPTVAHMMASRNDLEPVGFFYPQEKIVAITDVEKFKHWLGIEGDIPADELYV